MSQSVSQGVLAYVGYDGDQAVPGRYPDRVDAEIRDHVLEVVEVADAARPGDGETLFGWAERVRLELIERFPEVDEPASIALRALISYEWR